MGKTRNNRHNISKNDTWRTLHYRGYTFPDYVISIDGRVKHVYSNQDLVPFTSGCRNTKRDCVSCNGIKVRIPRAMIETWRGFQLEPGEDVHHIDCDHENNCLSNLLVMTHEAHLELHRKMNKERGNEQKFIYKNF